MEVVDESNVAMLERSETTRASMREGACADHVGPLRGGLRSGGQAHSARLFLDRSFREVKVFSERPLNRVGAGLVDDAASSSSVTDMDSCWNSMRRQDCLFRLEFVSRSPVAQVCLRMGVAALEFASP